MKYYSEVTGKFYESEKDAAKAEAEAKKAAEEKAKKDAELKETRKARAKEIEDAHAATLAARKHEQELIDKFVQDYQTYHFTISNTNDLFGDVFENFFRIF